MLISVGLDYIGSQEPWSNYYCQLFMSVEEREQTSQEDIRLSQKWANTDWSFCVYRVLMKCTLHIYTMSFSWLGLAYGESPHHYMDECVMSKQPIWRQPQGERVLTDLIRLREVSSVGTPCCLDWSERTDFNAHRSRGAHFKVILHVKNASNLKKDLGGHRVIKIARAACSVVWVSWISIYFDTIHIQPKEEM